MRQKHFAGSINSRNLITLKKQNINAQKMSLHGWGRVKAIQHDRDYRHTLEMEWSPQTDVIEIPLMGVTRTVNPRALKDIEERLPEEFFAWLEKE